MSNSATNILPVIELNTGSSPTHTIIWLHGLGADGNDFVPIVNELQLPTKIQAKFIFPHAPEQSISINNGYIMRAWYDIFSQSIDANHDEVGIKASQKAINVLIENEIQKGVVSENIILAGFSQGGAMALQVGLRQSNPLGGIMALSCYLPLANTLTTESSSINTTVPIFMAHGVDDAVIPLSQAIASKNLLLREGYLVEWHEYAMAHTVSRKEIKDIRDWLLKILI